MLRHPSLVPLSHQHHNGLALCVLTDRALAASASPESVSALARRICERYDIELVNHFELEENVLFPLCPGALTAELTAEHRQLEALVAQLRQQPTPASLSAFTQLLRRHIRREERELFEQAQQSLSAATLASIGHILDQKAVRICL